MVMGYIGLEHTVLAKGYAALVRLFSFVLTALVLIVFVCWMCHKRNLGREDTSHIPLDSRSVIFNEIKFFKKNNMNGGRMSSQRYRSDNIHGNMTRREKVDVIHRNILQRINSDNIKTNSRHYSKYPHEPGSKRNAKLGREMAKLWKRYGFDTTEIFEYDVLLSFPEKPAEIHLMENSLVVKKIIVDNEPAFGESEKKGKPIYPYFAYTVSGDITAEAVFCNYGKTEDYEELKNLNVDLKKKIFILKQEIKSSRHKLLERAIQHGALGVLFYSDPADFTNHGEEYPEGWMLNKYGVIRRSFGNTADFRGDLLSNGYPSKESYYRERITRMKKFQYKLPSQPISALTASQLFNFMKDNSTKVPSSFLGNMNVTYVLQSGKNRKITVKINNQLKDSTVLVVCGSLYGSVEPDRYVIIGNHRDAWGYGSGDPVSGSAVMTEIVRVLGEYKTDINYRPRRTIMVCSWGGEEMGLLGSTEWVEENSIFLSQKVIAYLNVDTAIGGKYTIKLKSLDHMAKSMFEAAKNVLSPDNSSITLFQDMCHKHAVLKHMTNDLKFPEYDSPGVVSDSMQFSEIYGIGVSEYRYTYNELDFPRLQDKYSHYHTLYDSYDWMTKFVDPTYKYHRTVGQLWLAHALILSDSTIIPLDMRTYVKQMGKRFDGLHQEYKSTLQKNNISLEFPKSRIKRLISQVNHFENTIKNLDVKQLSFNTLRAINDVIMNFGKQFMLKSDLGVQTLKQVYATFIPFKGIRLALDEDPGNNWNNVRKQITAFVWCVDMAIKSLDLSELQLEVFIQ